MDVNKWKNYIELLRDVPVDKDSLAAFSSLPSTNKFMSTNAHLQTVAFTSCIAKNDSMDTFWSKTLNTPDTVTHAIALIRKDIMTYQYQIEGNQDEGEKEWAPDVALVVQLGSQMNGFHNTVHGGLVAALLDECLGLTVETIRCCLQPGTKGLTVSSPLYTAYLHINYRRPTESPGVYIVEARLQRREGRKWMLQGRIRGDDGKVRADANSLWIAAVQKM